MDFRTLREEVWRANRALPALGLVVMHSGNASGIDRERGLVLIKPSGVDYETLRPEDLAVVTLDGRPATADQVPDGIETSLRPSVDTRHHLALYREDPSVGGVVHTHSNYATAWAAVGRPIPCALTAMADEFGGEIPCAPYADNEGDHIGEAILAARTRAPAVLLAGHGVFAFDASPMEAVKAAAMVEDAAKTLAIAAGLGDPPPLPPSEIETWWARYHETYGQR
ncbi:MAG: class II aldolase/adducin family protein [Candidatus Velamenicoccus archaeovorus]